MCDFSLHAVKNRLAVTGESLTIHKFHTGSKGLASPVDLEACRPRGLKRIWNFLMLEDRRAAARNIPAVCIPPGTRLRLSGIPKALQSRIGVSESEVVTFVQLSSEPFRYRDGVRFDNDVVALLQSFDEGLPVEVLILELKEEPAVGLAEELLAVPTNPGEWRMISNA